MSFLETFRLKDCCCFKFKFIFIVFLPLLFFEFWKEFSFFCCFQILERAFFSHSIKFRKVFPSKHTLLMPKHYFLSLNNDYLWDFASLLVSRIRGSHREESSAKGSWAKNGLQYLMYKLDWNNSSHCQYCQSLSSIKALNFMFTIHFVCLF